MKVAVVILNWNGRDFLEKFLPSVTEFSAEHAQVIVADNASTDGSVEFLKANFPDVQIIVNAENGGFSKGYNDALRQVETEYYVLLNSDVEVTENWIAPILSMMDADRSIGACQPKILCEHDRTRFEYAGAAGGFMDAYGYPFCRGRLFDVLEEDLGQYDDVREIFWATGACLFVRAELYHSLGGLDEDFFAHMEEIDFCWRLKNAGYKVMFCPDSAVYHVGGGSLPKSSSRKTYLNFRNNLLLLVKNLPASRIGWVLFVRMFLDILAALNFLLKGSRSDAGAVWTAQLHFIRALPNCLRKRRELQQKQVKPMFKGSIVAEHFLRKVSLFSELKSDKWQW